MAIKFKQLAFETDDKDGNTLTAKCPFGIYTAYFDRNGCDIYFGLNDGIGTQWITELTSGDREEAMKVIQADFEKRMKEGIENYEG